MLKSYRWSIIFALCVILTMGYIFGNSLQPQQDSAGASQSVTDQIKPLMDPDNRISEDVFHGYIRKVAHGAEFWVLGIFLSLFFYQIGTHTHQRYISLPLLLVLCTAVTDEWLQSFNDRSSELRDVLIDFAGGAVGIGVVLLVLWLLTKTKEAN